MEEVKEKKILRKPKSKPYPYYSLKYSVKFANTIYDIGATGIAPVDSILSEMDVGTTNNKRYTYSRSSAIQYGLITKEEDGLKITESAKLILFPSKPNDPTCKKLLIEALMRPTIFRELIIQYKGVKLPKNEYLKNIFRQKGIIESSLNAVVKSFIDSLICIEILSPDNRIVIDDEILNSIIDNYEKIHKKTHKQKKIPEKINKISKVSHIIENKDIIHKDDSVSKTTKKKEDRLEKIDLINRDTENYFKMEIPFSSGKTAVLVVPKECTEDDINLLKSFIDTINKNISHK